MLIDKTLHYLARRNKVKRNTPLSVVLRKGSREKIQVLALDSKRSVSWMIAECVELILAKPENQQRAYDAAFRILSKDPSFRPAETVLREGKPAQVCQQPASTPPTPKETDQTSSDEQPTPARVQQPVFPIESLAPTNPLPIAAARPAPSKPAFVSPAAPVTSAATAAVDSEPELGDPRPGRGLIGR
jgi:hypothetical protein